MAASDFLNRWSKTKPVDAASPEPAASQAAPAPARLASAEPESRAKSVQAQPLPTLEDVAKLAPNSDYSAFVAKGVDENVKRLAMKKLFSDPHFNIMDGLDIYIDDYNKFEPIPPEMLAMLDHAKSILDPLGHLESSGMRMISRDDVRPPEQDALQADTGTDDAPAEAKVEGADAQKETEPSQDATADEAADDVLTATEASGAEDAAAPSAADTVDSAMENESRASRAVDPAGQAGQPVHQSGAAARPDGKS